MVRDVVKHSGQDCHVQDVGTFVSLDMAADVDRETLGIGMWMGERRARGNCSDDGQGRVLKQG